MGVQRFVSGSREQAFLLPPDMREWLPAEHLVWLVVEAIGHCDVAGLRAGYRDDGQGRPAYDPVALATVLVYAYAVGERSSRQIEQRCREDVAFRVAAAGLQPDHVTIARFRRRHADALCGLFSGVLGLCARAGLVQVGLVAIDGTKVRANANKDRVALSPDEAARRVLEEAGAVDAAEDALPGDQQAALRGLVTKDARSRLAQAAPSPLGTPRAESVPRRLNADERGRLRAERRRGRPNLTDPQSRVMRDSHGWVQGYNAQVAVGDSHLVLACDVSTDNADNGLLAPMIARTEEALHSADVTTDVGCYLADGGYWNGEAVTELRDTGLRVLVPPNGRPVKHAIRVKPSTARMRRRLARAPAQARYRRRQALVEPVIAHIKILRRLDRLHLRGLAGAKLEWTLACTAHNLHRLHHHRLQTA
jgi:transposase